MASSWFNKENPLPTNNPTSAAAIFSAPPANVTAQMAALRNKKILGNNDLNQRGLLATDEELRAEISAAAEAAGVKLTNAQLETQVNRKKMLSAEARALARATINANRQANAAKGGRRTHKKRKSKRKTHRKRR